MIVRNMRGQWCHIAASVVLCVNVVAHAGPAPLPSATNRYNS
jgi:hypothetical protein